MKLTILTEQRYLSTPDHAVWDQTVGTYGVWATYLNVFSQVEIVARVKSVAQKPEGCRRVDGRNVGVVPLPFYVGPLQYAARVAKLKRILRPVLLNASAVLLRVPSQLANLGASVLDASHKPYAVEVLGDPYDVFAANTINHPLRRYFRWKFSRALRRQCRRALGAAYVTQAYLQNRYPPGPRTLSASFSDIELPETALRESPREFESISRPLKVVTVGSLAQLYKAPDVLIASVGYCRQRGLPLNLTIVGDGRYRPFLQEKTKALNLDGMVRFLGQLPSGRPVFEQLDNADLFILPSRTEGLPRALIEAMARALPCIGTEVGGIPELLEREDIVAAGDHEALGSKIIEVASSNIRLARMSERNLKKAAQYTSEAIWKRRQQFYLAFDELVRSHSRRIKQRNT